MKKTIAAFALALLGSTAIASAADLPSRAYPAAPVLMQAAPVFTWTGVYVGLNGGYAWGEQKLADTYNYVGASKFDQKGWLLGGTIGAQYQFANNIVLGVETDLAYADIKHSSSYATDSYYGEGNTYSTTLSVDSKLNTFGTARVRAGYAMGAFLPYITGGVAFVSTKTNLAVDYYHNQSHTGGDAISGNKTNSWGWTVGAGLEYAISRNWSVKGEYLYVKTGDINHSFPVSGPVSFGVKTDGHLHVARAGINYRF